MGQIVTRILLVDLNDFRRETLVELLKNEGYQVFIRDTWRDAGRLDHEGRFDLIIVALRIEPADAAAYSEQLKNLRPTLPVLLLTDYAVFVPRGTICEYIQSGKPIELLRKIAGMLADSHHVREL